MGVSAMLEDMADAREERRVGAGRYQIVREVGRGAQGCTLLARRVEDGQQVLLKELHFSQLKSVKGLELFEREVAALKRIDTPGVPRYIDAFSEADPDGRLQRYILVQEYIDGDNLRELIRSGELFDEAEVRVFLGQLLDTLAYLHALLPPVIHRDIKPSNVIRHPDGRYVLVDFGAVAQELADVGGGSTVAGSTGYAPLEQLMGRAVAASDLYALGMTAIFLLSRVEPEVLTVDALVVDFRARVQVSPQLADYLEVMCAREVEDRFVSSEVARRALDDPQVVREYRAREASRAGAPARADMLRAGAPEESAAARKALARFVRWPLEEEAEPGARDWVRRVNGAAFQQSLARLNAIRMRGADAREAIAVSDAGHTIIARSVALGPTKRPANSKLNVQHQPGQLAIYYDHDLAAHQRARTRAAVLLAGGLAVAGAMVALNKLTRWYEILVVLVCCIGVARWMGAGILRAPARRPVLQIKDGVLRMLDFPGRKDSEIPVGAIRSVGLAYALHPTSGEQQFLLEVQTHTDQSLLFAHPAPLAQQYYLMGEVRRALDAIGSAG